jgi:integrase
LTQKEYKRPDEATMLRILDNNQLLLAETLIVLAWRLGLSRDEIYNLKWSDFSLL